MMQFCQKGKEYVLNAIKYGHIDDASLSLLNLIDTIVLTMKQKSLLEPFGDCLEDKCFDNKKIHLTNGYVSPPITKFKKFVLNSFPAKASPKSKRYECLSILAICICKYKTCL
jgi:hypothetical protein